MPGWYVHMEAARLAAERLAAGDVPTDHGLDPAEARRLGALARKWRNYLAAGALGPDLFFLLPDFEGTTGGTLRGVANWVLTEWEKVEREFLGPMDKWMGPVGANTSDLSNQLTGGLSGQLSAALEEVASILLTAIQSAITRSTDVFGRLTSGVPQGLAESKFYWSDMCHYRRTYQVPTAMYRRGRKLELTGATDGERSDGQAQQAFALGWMAHCGTDVVGHAFTNAKSGGPFRLHWQRHHLVENHFDSRCYDDRNGNATHYKTIGTSALHFRIAFREHFTGPYAGRKDGPAYDYFAVLPSYNTGHTAAAEHTRRQHFSMAPADMPAHLVRLITESLKEVYAGRSPDITPRILANGSPDATELQTMWDVVFRFLSHMGSSGFATEMPPAPEVINEHPFPSPPGGGPGAGAGRGADPGAGDDDYSLLDVLLAVLAWVLFVAQIAVWLATVLPGLILDIATFPARAFLYYAVVAPLHSMHMAARRMLVMTGFLTPQTEEIDSGLVTLGRTSAIFRDALIADLADPTGFASTGESLDETSGRATEQSEWHLDPAYPRDTPRDPEAVLAPLLQAMGVPPNVPKNGKQQPYSEWVAPWRYPHRDIAGHQLGWEAHITHAGPFVAGQDASVLLATSQTNVPAALAYERSQTPEQTESISAARLPLNEHLGNPVDYSLYLIARLTSGGSAADFNLDSDRGYAWQCWDWTRHRPGQDPESGVDPWLCRPVRTAGGARFDMQQPCTPPAQMDPYWAAGQSADPAPYEPEHRFEPTHRRLTRYLIPSVRIKDCGDQVEAGIAEDQLRRARARPEGEG